MVTQGGDVLVVLPQGKEALVVQIDANGIALAAPSPIITESDLSTQLSQQYSTLQASFTASLSQTVQSLQSYSDSGTACKYVGRLVV